ncbi:MAG TPA: succinate dehydrogenase cytochrome b subunit [Candidatus Eisenbacteria bacterium]|jgi:succinate dehydrogenase / fumarate reductase cytochrome b subunit
MPDPRGFLGTTVGRKIVMAATGIVLFGFVLLHMLGNLQAFMGPEALNHYAVWLRELGHGGALWIFRAVLLVSVALHVWAATVLTLENLRARRVGYRERAWQRSTYASRTMVWSGPIVALFVVYHILHFTTGTVHPSFVEGDVYHNFVAGFRVVPVSVFYIVAMLALGYHLYHGFWSMLQTLGLSHPRYNPLRHAASAAFTFAIVGVNISFPVAVLTGIIR